MAHFLHRDWHQSLSSLVKNAQHRLVVVSPFISSPGAELIVGKAGRSLCTGGTIEVITDLSVRHVVDGALSLAAVDQLLSISPQVQLRHVPRLHAKVYIADNRDAIVTSGNLTAAALYRNTEYGVRFKETSVVQRIDEDFDEVRAVGLSISPDALSRFAAVASKAAQAARRCEAASDSRLKNAYDHALQDANDELIRLRLAGGAVHTVFARTILYILKRYGPLPTTWIHEHVCRLHPDLCDDSVDRIIDGKRFGKKWKHAVRTAQQQLKSRNEIKLKDGKWRVIEV